MSQDQLRDIYGKQIPQKAKAVLHCPEQHRALLPWQVQEEYTRGRFIAVLAAIYIHMNYVFILDIAPFYGESLIFF